MTLLPDPEGAVPWRLLPLVELHWRRWEDEWLVFDAGSGKTHRIDTLTALSLMVLEDGPATPSAIEAAIATELDLDAQAAAEHFPRLPDILASLQHSGLADCGT